MYCRGKYCSNREKWESLDGYVTTPRPIFGCGMCGAWLFVHKVPFTSQEQVKATKTDKTRFLIAKKDELGTQKKLLPNVPFQSTKYRKKELSVDDKVEETIGDVYFSTCRIEKYVYISTNKTTSFYDCINCTDCCNVLKIPFMDQKPTIMLFGVDCTHCFAGRTSLDYKKDKPSPFLKKFLRQS